MATRVELKRAHVLGPNPSKFDEPLKLNIVFDIFGTPPKSTIDVKFTWSPIWDFPVDQELDELEVGPFTSPGRHEFTIESDPPDFSKIPDPTGPTALLVSFTYEGNEFLHVGYNMIVTCDGDIPDVFETADLLWRRVGQSFPRQHSITWDEKPTAPPASQEEGTLKKPRLESSQDTVSQSQEEDAPAADTAGTS